MVPRPKNGGRRAIFMAAAATALLAALGTAVLYLGVTGSPNPSPPVDDSPAAVTERSTGGSPGPSGSKATGIKPPPARTGQFLPGSLPVGLDISRIGVHSSNIVGLGLQEDGSLEVPDDASAPGWFSPGPSPGQLGPAVIAGHVDSKTGPAVFYRLGELRRGDRIKVTRADGSAPTFIVDRVETYEKNAFPTRLVYGPTDRAELRLITCSGTYDDNTGYDSNTVVYAHLA